MVIGVGLWPNGGRAFQIDSPVTDDCHERITASALREAGWPGGAIPVEFDDYQERIHDDLPFSLPADLNDPWSMALLIGAREPDLEGHSTLDLPALSHVHGHPDKQDAHCLRAPAHDGELGDSQALSACKDFILSELRIALGTEAGSEQFQGTTQIPVSLVFRGEVDVELQRFGFHLGRALHALQDGFSHTFRSSDGSTVHSVLNWTDWIKDHYDSARDGHQHLSPLDECSDAAPAELRVGKAVEASTALLESLSDIDATNDARIAAAADVVDRYLALEPGCSAENDWCDAPERFEESTMGCSVSSRSQGLWWLAIVLFAFFWRRHRLWSFTGLVVAVMCMCVTSQAHAQERAPGVPWGLYAAGGVSIDRGALAFSFGGRAQLNKNLYLGADLEYNPWFSLETGEFADGVINAYATIILAWARLGDMELRTSGHLGISVLLFDLVGADEGSVGPFGALTLLGIAWDLGPQVKWVIDPAQVAVPIPQVTGIPFYYLQYRFVTGIQWVF